jgi:hypothetical protein
VNTMTAEHATWLAARIREHRWGWRRAFAAWYLINGGSPNITIENGVRTVERDATEFIKTNPDALDGLGLGDVVQADGTLRLDSAGEYRYRPLGVVDHGFTAYERIH